MRHFNHHHHAGPRGAFARGPFGGGFGPGHTGGGAFGFGGPRGGGRRKRLFDQAELQSLLLDLIAEQPRHGYDLIRAIETLTGGEYAPSPGVVYPALSFMEEQGIIVAADEGSRKSFTVTEEGRRLLAEQADAVVALRARLSALADAREKTDPAPVRRAMHSMKTALFDRLSQEGADRATVLAIAEIIDEAARKIERIEP